MRRSSISAIRLLAIFSVAFMFTSRARAQEEVQRPDTTAPTFTYSILDNFTGASGAVQGANPYWSAPIQASDGNYYGTAQTSGAASDGVVYQLTPGNVYTVIQDFSNYPTNGAFPSEPPIQGTDGNLYGTTGTLKKGAGYGTIFKMTLAGAMTILHSFDSTDGSGPGGVIEGTDGNFYGTTGTGGIHNDGVVFKITPSGTFTVLHNFAGGSTDGIEPAGNLVQGTDGNFYGLTASGGANNKGMIFNISSGGTFTVVHSFATSDGYGGFAWPIQATDGNWYGTTLYGGVNNDGTVYQLTPGGTYTVLHNFSSSTTDGWSPYAPLTEGSDGNFYGTTNSGGTLREGTTFQITSTGVFTLLHSFTGSTTDGNNIYATLYQGSDGNFRGTSPTDGANGDGLIFEETASPALPGPVQLSVTGAVYAGQPFTLSYLTANAGSETLQQCFATNTAGDTTGWTGIKTSLPTATNASLTASSTPGTYTYTLTCGGMETGSLGVVVGRAPEATATAVSANPSFIAATGSTTVTATVTDTITPANTPAGSVTLKVGGTTLGSCTLSSGSCSIAVSGASLSNGSNTITAAYAPSSGWTASSGTGTVTVTSNVVTFTAVTHNFGTLPVGTAATSFGIAVKNTSTTTAYAYSLNFTPANGFTTATNCPASLAAGASCELVFYFTPTVTGTVTATWSLGTSSNFAYSPSNGGTLTGTGTTTGSVTLTTSGHNFGTQAVGTTSSAYGTELSNSTGSTETITLGPVPSGPFTLLTNCGTTLAVGANCEIEFTFTPTTTSPVSIVVPLSGTPTAITSGGVALPGGGITLSGN